MYRCTFLWWGKTRWEYHGSLRAVLPRWLDTEHRRGQTVCPQQATQLLTSLRCTNRDKYTTLSWVLWNPAPCTTTNVARIPPRSSLSEPPPISSPSTSSSPVSNQINSQEFFWQLSLWWSHWISGWYFGYTTKIWIFQIMRIKISKYLMITFDHVC